MTISLHRISFILFFSISLLIPLTAQESLFLESTTVQPGDALTAFVFPVDKKAKVQFSLKGEKGIVISTVPAIFLELEKDQYAAVALIPVPADTAKQSCSLNAEVKSEKIDSYLYTEVEVIGKVFESYTLNIDSTVTGNIQSNPARRRKESQIYWATVSKVDPTGNNNDFKPLISPVKNFIPTSPYGQRRIFKYSNGQTARSIHAGYDMAADTGTAVIAPGRGKVVMAEKRIVTGWTVVLEHFPGIYTCYFHMDSVASAVGEYLEKGEKIGEVGATGLVTGPHLHWELKIHRISIDPTSFVGKPFFSISSMRRVIKEQRQLEKEKTLKLQKENSEESPTIKEEDKKK